MPSKTTPQSGWRAKTGLFEPKHVERTIGEATWRFYPVRVSRLFQLRETIKSVTSSLAILFGANRDDCGQEIEKIVSGDGEIQRTNVRAIEPGLAELRAKQKRDSIAQAVDALMSDQNQITVGRLLADSLREEFPTDASDAEIKEFIGSLDISQMVEMLQGFAAANAKVFGPVGEQMREALQSRLAKLAASAGGSQGPNTPAS